MSLFSSSNSSSYRRELPIRDEFAAELVNLHLEESHEDAAKVLSVVQGILASTPGLPVQINSESRLGERVRVFQKILDRSVSGGEVHAVVMASLRGEMRAMVKTVRFDIISRLCKEILTEIPQNRFSVFLDTVEGFYSKALLDGKTSKEALIFSLAKGMLRCIVTLPSESEMPSNVELQRKIEADDELRDYICVITGTLVGEDAAYLREGKAQEPLERYHEASIREWIVQKRTDPMNRQPRGIADIKQDLKGAEFVKNKLLTFMYPSLVSEHKEDSYAISELETLHNKGFLLSLAAAFSVIKAEYREAISQPYDLNVLMEALDASSRETISRVTSVIDDVSFEEKIDPKCFSVIKELLRQAVEKLGRDNLTEIKAEWLSKLGVFLSFFQEIESSQMSSDLKHKSLQIAERLIKQEACLGALKEDVDSIITEEMIRLTFPGCLVGKAEWDEYVGIVEAELLPEEIFAVLNQDCPFTLNKKVGETHVLLLIPETVNGAPLTINSLGVLLRDKGKFSAGDKGYGLVDRSFLAKHADKPARPSHFVLMTKSVLPSSLNKSYVELKKMGKALEKKLGVSYEVPDALSAVASTYMTYLSSNLANNCIFTFCKERCYYGVQVLVGAFFQERGLMIIASNESSPFYGVAPLIRF